jgi:hypothetical protein
MAKSPSKAAAKPAAEVEVPAKPKAAKLKPAKPTKSASKPRVAKPAAEPAAVSTASKPKKGAAPKAKAAGKSVFKETSDKIAQLAADILADRIVPTIEQIKAIAASALGKGETRKKKPKGKKK